MSCHPTLRPNIPAQNGTFVAYMGSVLVGSVLVGSGRHGYGMEFVLVFGGIYCFAPHEYYRNVKNIKNLFKLNSRKNEQTISKLMEKESEKGQNLQ